MTAAPSPKPLKRRSVFFDDRAFPRPQSTWRWQRIQRTPPQPPNIVRVKQHGKLDGTRSRPLAPCNSGGRTNLLLTDRGYFCRTIGPHHRKDPAERGWVSVYRENVVQFASCNRGCDPTAVFAPGRLRRATRPKTPTATPESVTGEIQSRLDNLKRYIHKTTPK